jgi:hypothetical protein
MAGKSAHREAPTAFLETLRGLPFVRKASFAPTTNHTSDVDGRLTIDARRGRYTLNVIQKRSFLDRASQHALSAASKAPLMVFARYIPRPAGEKLMAAGVNFVDQAGNMHVALGTQYAHTVLGHPQPRTAGGERRATAALVQMLFGYAADHGLLARPVREITRAVGVSKSNVARLRPQLLEEGPRPAGVSSASVRSLPGRLLHGYADVLRPKLILGRFRAPEALVDAFVDRLRQVAKPASLRFSLTGGPAAERLQHFYRGAEITVFVDPWTPEASRRLQLLPDRDGPVTLLRPFGELPFWQVVDGVSVAHPWLIYAELMYMDDPRAHEAAEELRREYLAT